MSWLSKPVQLKGGFYLPRRLSLRIAMLSNASNKKMSPSTWTYYPKLPRFESAQIWTRCSNPVCYATQRRSINHPSLLWTNISQSRNGEFDKRNPNWPSLLLNSSHIRSSRNYCLGYSSKSYSPSPLISVLTNLEMLSRFRLSKFI